MLEDLPKYRASGLPCDFVLECDGIEFPVHKAVLCSRSKFFDRMCNGDFRVRFLPYLLSVAVVVLLFMFYEKILYSNLLMP